MYFDIVPYYSIDQIFYQINRYVTNTLIRNKLDLINTNFIMMTKMLKKYEPKLINIYLCNDNQFHKKNIDNDHKHKFILLFKEILETSKGRNTIETQIARKMIMMFDMRKDFSWLYQWFVSYVQIRNLLAIEILLDHPEMVSNVIHDTKWEFWDYINDIDIMISLDQKFDFRKILSRKDNCWSDLFEKTILKGDCQMMESLMKHFSLNIYDHCDNYVLIDLLFAIQRGTLSEGQTKIVEYLMKNSNDRSYVKTIKSLIERKNTLNQY